MTGEPAAHAASADLGLLLPMPPRLQTCAASNPRLVFFKKVFFGWIPLFLETIVSSRDFTMQTVYWNNHTPASYALKARTV